MENVFDIMKVRSDDSLTWVEAAEELSAAKVRVCELLAGSPGEYIVFNQLTKKLVSHFSTTPVLEPCEFAGPDDQHFAEPPQPLEAFEEEPVAVEVGVA